MISLTPAVLALMLGATPAASGVKIVVLPIRSHTLSAAESAMLTRQLQASLDSDADLDVIDPRPALIVRWSDKWLEADKLLFDGIEDYRALRYGDAVEKLSRAEELSRDSYRVYGEDVGAVRMREIYLYLGLARLELGEDVTARRWFQSAIRMDSGFEPDARKFSPAVRDAYAKARESLELQPDVPRELLASMAQITAADVVVTGSCTVAENPGTTADLLVYDARKGVTTGESLRADRPDLEHLQQALQRKMPELRARLANRPWPPPASPATLPGVRVMYSTVYMPHATVGMVRIQTQRFVYDGALTLQGMGVHFKPWTRGDWSVDAGISLFLPRDLGRGGLNPGTNPTGALFLSAALRTDLYYSREIDRFTVGLGAGLGVRYMLASYTTDQSQSSGLWLWFSPRASGYASYDLGRRTYVQIMVSTEYDVAGARRDRADIKDPAPPAAGGPDPTKGGIADWTFIGSVGLGLRF